MPPFVEPDWSRFDYWAIVASSGIATIEERRYPACRQWLQREHYYLTSLDCSCGFDSFIAAYSTLMRWEDEFGYSLSPERCNLDAVRDGFYFDASLGSGHVLELIRPDILWADDHDWLYGFLSIAHDHSRFHLSLGKRFFTVLVLPEPTPFVGAVYDLARIPGFYFSPPAEKYTSSSDEALDSKGLL